ncbi:hypothetical protein H5085_03095 [Pseudoalteromonas sp. SR43-6]|uniref:hypothetical protein n=1 Tax=unclassified Pseudoalteromonas TaxID=194690 RepID=UPI0015FCB7EB|nr:MULTISPECIES: hypothetical protein [unclassified Pseudoalteromonas]MBB1287545.1 hypothetical protein [Pseudoalteromonas sp. SR41-5]MBB1373325.1 hypothetical protein [Pseudoalteromonas sp. SR43-6]MBB1412186.1 hypothetical protein [Pseudoalteromonas sp. SG43-8]
MNKIIIGFAFAISSFGAFAQSADAWPEGGAMHTGKIYNLEGNRYKIKISKMMDEIYPQLTDGYQVDAVKAQIKTWEQYIDATCNVVGIATGAGGSWPSTYSVKCERSLSYDRYFATKNALKCVNKLSEEEFVGRSEKLNCLIQTLNIKLF